MLVFTVMDTEYFENPTHPLNGKEYEITYVLSGWGIENGYVALGIVPRAIEAEEE